jgi:hypothetical protein
VLKGEGLPVEPIRQDTIVRVGRCFGHYIGGDASSWNADKDYVDLKLDLGAGDKVTAGDRYDVLGDPEVDSVNFAVTGFEQIGGCVVQPLEVSRARAVCRMDRITWGKFTQDRWVRGGYVRLRKPASTDM